MVVTQQTDTAIDQALKILEGFLARTPDRTMFSRTEVQDLALDLHLVLAPMAPEEAPQGVPAASAGQ